MRILIVIILMLLCALAHGQTHTMPGSNVVPSGASLTINSGASITAAAGSTVTGFGTGGGSVSLTATTPIVVTPSPITGTGVVSLDPTTKTNWDTAFTDRLKWDGGSTGLTAATGRTSLGATTVGSNIFTLTNPSAVSWLEISAVNAVTAVSAATMRTDLGLVIGTNVQAFDADLTTWSGVTPTAGIQTWLATPSSANLRGALTDENGTGAALFSGATTPDFTTGFTIGAAAASGKVMKGNGTNFVPSTETYAAPGTSGNLLTSDGTNWTSAAPVVTASNTVTFTNKRVTPRVTSTASATTWAPSADTDDVYEITAQTAAVTTISNPAGTPVDGQSLIIRFSDNGTARALTWSGTQWQAGPGLALPTSTIVGNHDYVGFKWNSTTSKWTMVASTQLNGTVDDTAYASSWNGVTGIAGSKNSIYDELHLIDTADNGTIVNAGTGFIIAGTNPASGKILQSNGTNYINSSFGFPTLVGAAGYTVRSDGTNLASYPSQLVNSSVASQATFSTSDLYVTGSNITVAAGDFKAKGQYKCVFDMTKSAGTGAIVITLRVGTLGTTGDAAIQTYTFGAGTGVADTGIFEIIATWRTVGSGTSAVIQGICRGTHNLATTGLFSNAAGFIVIGSPSPSSGFASSSATQIGISFNGSTAFAGTATMVQAQLQQ